VVALYFSGFCAILLHITAIPHILGMLDGLEAVMNDLQLLKLSGTKEHSNIWQ